MIKKEMDYENAYRKLLKRFVFGALILIIIFITRQVIIQKMIAQETEMIGLINIAGRQRMLSQKIAKDILMIGLDQDTIEIEYYKEDLKTTVTIWELSHIKLTTGQISDDIKYQNSHLTIHMYEDMEPFYQSMLQSVKEVIDIISQPGYDVSLLKDKITIIAENETKYLSIMNDIVLSYDEENSKSISSIENIEMLLFILMVILAFLISIYLFTQIKKGFRNAFEEVTEARENIIKMLHALKGALFIIDSNGNVILMNSDAEKLLIFDKLQINTFNIKQNIKWVSIEINQLLEKVIADGQVEDINVEIEDKNGLSVVLNISAVKGIYKRKDAILLSLYDVTSQKRAEAVLKEMAVKDELTGLFNRHFFDTIINEEIDRAERYEIPLSVFMLDLDHFKKVNDRWGHPVGDTVLKQTAELMVSNTRMSDYVIRIGGEEFVVLMPHTNIEGAFAAAEKVRKAIESSLHPVVGKFTASIGVAERMAGETYRTLYKRMDSALYEAKESGRNCVIRAARSGNEFTAVALNWKNSWNCGEQNIDLQHRELFNMISKFINSSFTQEDKEQAVNYLNIILEHVTKHFEYEESVLERVKFDGLGKHKIMHKHLLERGIETRDAVVEGSIECTKAFLFLFDEVIVGHLLREDVKFFPNLN